MSNEAIYYCGVCGSTDLSADGGGEAVCGSCGHYGVPECADDWYEDDGQPDEYTEWQDYMGGDEYYDHSESNLDFWGEY